MAAASAVNSKVQALEYDRIGQMAEDNLPDHFTLADRRLLIELAVKMELALTQLKDVKVDTERRALDLRSETEKRAGELRLETVTTHGELEKRVRTLENFRWWLLGAVAFVSPMLAALTSYVVARLTHP